MCIHVYIEYHNCILASIYTVIHTITVAWAYYIYSNLPVYSLLFLSFVPMPSSIIPASLLLH